MKQFFNILIVLALTVFSTQDLVANDVFSLTEKSYVSVEDINNAGGKVFKTFSRPIAFGGDIVRNTGKKLNILGRANPKRGSIGTKKIYDELIEQGIPENELVGLFQIMPRKWNKMKIIDMNTKYWKEINKPHIDKIIANGGDIRFIHDPRLPINQYSIIDDLPETNLIEKAFKAKAKKEGLKKIPTFLKWEYDYLLKQGYVLKNNGLMVKL